MRYLLDVNALIAFGHTGHEFHQRILDWVASLEGRPQFATTPITELGFVRILFQAYLVPIEKGKKILVDLSEFEDLDFTFIPDDHSVSKLPSWVSMGKQTTDGHLVELAKANSCTLATFDEKIADALVIPT